MPILPIDLQTIFSQIGNVGKDQAVQRDIAPLQQTLQGTQMVQQTLQQDRSVNEPRDSRDGERIRDEEKKGQARGGEEGERKPGSEPHPEGRSASGKEVFKDPALGTHIDVVR